MALLVAACGDDGASVTTSDSTVAPTTTPADTSLVSTSAGATSVPTTDGPPSSSAPEQVCPDGELAAAGAVDLATGDTRWVVCSPTEAYRTLVAASGDAVVLSELVIPDLDTVTLAAADGTEQWRRATAGQQIDAPRGPGLGGGVVLRSIDDGGGTGTGGGGALAGLDAATGDIVWQLDERLEVLGQSDTVAVVTSFDPGAGGGAAGPPVVRGIDRATGVEVWASDVVFNDLSGVAVARGPAAVWEGTIAVPTGESLTALDIATGTVRWVGPQTDHPEAAEGVVVGTTDSGRTVRALDAFSGELLWEAPGRASYGDLLAVGDGIVVVNSSEGQQLIAYHLRDGSERWRIDARGVGEPQVIVDGTLVSLWEGTLSAVSTPDGTVRWSRQEPLDSMWMSSVATDGAVVYVAANSRPWGD